MIAAHVAKHGHKLVTPTVHMMRHWWARINREVFDGLLMPCQLSVGDLSAHAAQGLCWPLDSGRVKIEVDPTWATSRVAFLSILAHEMTHQYQHQNGLGLTHGPTFTGWADHFKALGLSI